MHAYAYLEDMRRTQVLPNHAWLDIGFMALYIACACKTLRTYRPSSDNAFLGRHRPHIYSLEMGGS